MRTKARYYRAYNDILEDVKAASLSIKRSIASHKKEAGLNKHNPWKDRCGSHRYGDKWYNAYMASKAHRREIGKRLAIVVDSCGLERREIAQLIGVTPGTFDRYLREGGTWRAMFILTYRLGIDANWLIYGMAKPWPQTKPKHKGKVNVQFKQSSSLG